MIKYDLDPIKQIPILEIAARLGIEVKGKKAMCFTGHDKRTPSLTFSPDKNFWMCFGACGKSGDEIKLVMEVLGCDFKDALEWFAHEFCVDVRHDKKSNRYRRRTYSNRRQNFVQKVTSDRIVEKSEFSVDPELYTWLINGCGTVSQKLGLQYLESHGIPISVANRFGVCELCNPDRTFRRMVDYWGAERVFHSGLTWGKLGVPERLIWTSYTLVFPFYDKGAIIYIQGRLFKGEPKYLNLRGITKPLYNIDCIKTLGTGAIIHMCEGIPDALALEGKDLPAIAVLGANSFRVEWVELFLKYDVVLIPDGDAGGETFRRKISELFRARGKTVRVVHVPDDMDVADVIASLRGNA